MTLRDVKVNFLIDVATDLFMQRSIQEVTIKDIALKAQVGEATIYRYFGKKQAIVAQSAMKLQTIVSKDYFQLQDKKNGYAKLEEFYKSYLRIFKNHSNFYKFLNEFDIYMSEERNDVLSPYETAIDQFRAAYMSAYQEGLKDGSIKEQSDIETFYFSTTHALLELCKKLAFRKAVLNQDNNIQKEDEIKCLIDIILMSLNNL